MTEQILELEVKSTAEGAIKSIKLLNSTLKETKDKIDDISKIFSLKKAYQSVKNLTTQFLKWMDLTVDRTEQLNLFNVVFKNIEKDGKKSFSVLGKEATQFQNKLNEAFGTNLTETTKLHGLFQSMGENVGIPDNYASIMSETMTKLTYDLASLYNKSEATTGEALRAGVYAGQTKPLRSFGIDVTQQSMQPILDELGIERSVKQMSQAEKEILRYIATLRQGQIAMGDFANTIESPANQMKIFKQQLVESKVAITSLFIGSFSKILPYANAFLMLVKEISKSIGLILGVNLSDYNSSIASSEEAYLDFGETIDDTTDKIKELKRQVLGFDQINNISENKDSDKNNNFGIDQRLLDIIKGYDNGMDKVRMKATEIRDRWMEILGFTKMVNEETGETYFVYNGLESTLKGLVKWWKDLTIQGKLFSGLGIGIIFTNIYKTIQKFIKILDIKPIISGITKSFASLLKVLGISISTLGLIIGAIIAVGGALVYAYNKNEEFENKVHEVISSVFNLCSILKDLLKDLFIDFFDFIIDVSKQILEVLEPVWNFISDTMIYAVKTAYENIVFIFSVLFDEISGICKIISDLIHGDFKQAFEDTKIMVKNLHENWKNYFKNIHEVFCEWISNTIHSASQFVEQIIDKLGNVIKWLQEMPNKFFYYAGYAVGTLWKVITETDWLKLGKTILDGIVNGIINIGSSLINFGTDLFNKILDSIKKIDWKQIGIKILEGIKEGLMFFDKALSNWGKSFVDGIKDALGIHSPAKLVINAKIGDYTTDGIIVGMENKIPKLKNTASKMVNEINKTFERGDFDIGFAFNNITRPDNYSDNTDYSKFKNEIIDGLAFIMNGFSGQISQIDVHVHTDEGTVVDRINQKTKQTGVCPIDIPC